MPRFNGHFQTLKFKTDELQLDFRKIVVQRIRDAAREFLHTAFEVVPQQTGLAAGTFLDLAAALDTQLFILPVTTRPWHYQGGKAYRKVPESGTYFATHYLPDPNGNGPLDFTFQVTLNYFNIEEFFGLRSRTSPWHSFQEGQAKFMQKIREPLPIDLKSYTVRSTVSFGPGNKSVTEDRIRIRRSYTVK